MPPLMIIECQFILIYSFLMICSQIEHINKWTIQIKRERGKREKHWYIDAIFSITKQSSCKFTLLKVCGLSWWVSCTNTFLYQIFKLSNKNTGLKGHQGKIIYKLFTNILQQLFRVGHQSTEWFLNHSFTFYWTEGSIFWNNWFPFIL